MSGPAKEKMAPVQGYTPGIPWSLHLEAYDVYSRRWAPQPALIDLEGRGCRGGFSTSELDEFIPGWRDRASELVRVKAQRDELLTALKEAATSLETISILSGRKTFGQPPIETYMEDFMQVRGYANSRMTVARAAIAKAEGGAA